MLHRTRSRKRRGSPLLDTLAGRQHEPSRFRRLWFETLEDRRVLDAAVPTGVDLLPGSDSGLFDDDNLTNIRTATIEITAAEVGEAIRVYRDAVLVGEAAHHDGLLYRYTFAVGQLVEGPNTITARGFDGVAESADSPPLVITLDTLGPRIVTATPSAPFDLRAAALDSITVTFNEPIDAGSFTVDDIAIQGPAGAIPPTDITAHGDDQFQIHFAPQTQRGTYRVSVGPEVADLAGNLMDQNNNGTPGEPTDVYQYAIAAYDADAVFTTATTIAEGNTTYENQHLLINGTTVTINGPHNFASVHLINGAVLTHSANTTTQTYKLELAVTEQVIVDATSRIDVSGKGYLPGRTTGNTTVGGATSSSGGSYGGVGGGGAPNAVYGDYADPEDWGAGGG